MLGNDQESLLAWNAYALRSADYCCKYRATYPLHTLQERTQERTCPHARRGIGAICTCHRGPRTLEKTCSRRKELLPRHQDAFIAKGAATMGHSRLDTQTGVKS